MAQNHHSHFHWTSMRYTFFGLIEIMLYLFYLFSIQFKISGLIPDNCWLYNIYWFLFSAFMCDVMHILYYYYINSSHLQAFFSCIVDSFIDILIILFNDFALGGILHISIFDRRGGGGREPTTIFGCFWLCEIYWA